MPEPDSEFVRVECDDCGNEQVIFNKPSTEVRCLVCGSALARPKGGEGGIEAEVVGTVD